MFANIGWTEVLIIVALLVVLFGGSQLPKIARNMGQSGKELKKAKKELSEAITEKNNAL